MAVAVAVPGGGYGSAGVAVVIGGGCEPDVGVAAGSVVGVMLAVGVGVAVLPFCVGVATAVPF